MDAQQTFTFAPIGHIESCFRRLRGIPRQGALAPATKARLVLQSSVQACTADELERFSHVWILFVFHDNSSAENKQRPGHQDYRAKIAPPKLYAALHHLLIYQYGSRRSEPAALWYSAVQGAQSWRLFHAIASPPELDRPDSGALRGPYEVSASSLAEIREATFWSRAES